MSFRAMPTGRSHSQSVQLRREKTRTGVEVPLIIALTAQKANGLQLFIDYRLNAIGRNQSASFRTSDTYPERVV